MMPSQRSSDMLTPMSGNRQTPRAISAFHDWRCGARYRLIQILGHGSYGEVAKAYDTVTKRYVAIKRMRNVFHQNTDAKRIFREVHILRRLNHAHIIRLLDLICPNLDRLTTKSEDNTAKRAAPFRLGAAYDALYLDKIAQLKQQQNADVKSWPPAPLPEDDDSDDTPTSKKMRIDEDVVNTSVSSVSLCSQMASSSIPTPLPQVPSVLASAPAPVPAPALSTDRMHGSRRSESSRRVSSNLENGDKRNLSDALSDLYMVFEFHDTDLYKLIVSAQFLTTAHVQTFVYQLLVGIKYVHACNVIHRDLKPANILVNEDCTLRICDFGLARAMPSSSESTVSNLSLGTTRGSGHSKFKSTPCDINDESDKMSGGMQRLDKAEKNPDKHSSPSNRVHGNGNGSGNRTPEPSNEPGTPTPLRRQLTRHVVTRWYRAPELILMLDYTSAVDVWSLGCIFAELLGMQRENCCKFEDRGPLFPGRSCFPLSGDGLADHETSSSSSSISSASNMVVGSMETDNMRLDQLSVIFDIIGTPTEADIHDIAPMASDELITQLRGLERREGKDLSTLYPGADSSALALLTGMLHFSPTKRISVDDALAHPFFRDIRNVEAERKASDSATPLQVDAEIMLESVDQVLHNVIEEIRSYV